MGKGNKMRNKRPSLYGNFFISPTTGNRVSRVLGGFDVFVGDKTYTISLNKSLVEVIVELVHFGMTEKQIVVLTNKNRDSLRKILNSFSGGFNNCVFLMKFIPSDIVGYPAILETIERFKSCVSLCPSISILSSKLNITLDESKQLLSSLNLKSCFDYSTGLRIIESTPDVLNTSSVTPLGTFCTASPTISSDAISSDAIVSSTSLNVSPCSDEFVSSAIATEIPIVPLNCSEPNLRIKRGRKEITIEDYQSLLGFNGVLFDYAKWTSELTSNTSDFNTFISSRNVSGFSNLLYVLQGLHNIYNYSSPFYPAEDKILELYYKDVGISVLGILKSVIPDYTVRPYWEYANRIKERCVKTPHPLDSFIIDDNDISLLTILHNQKIKNVGRYLPWLDSFDVQYLLHISFGLPIETKRVKSPIDTSSLSIRTYISSAEKLKEVMYHSTLWTSSKHDLFKEKFKDIGLDVVDLLPGISLEDCRNHSLSYKIYQNYTSKEVENMKVVYEKSGFAGLVKAFPNRTEDALKYKIEEQKWDLGVHSLSSDELDKLVESKFMEKKDQFANEILVSERKKIENDLSIKLRSVIEKELTYKIRNDLEPKIRERELRQITSDLSKSIKTVLGSELRKGVHSIVSKSSLKDLPEVLPLELVELVFGLVDTELAKVLAKG